MRQGTGATPSVDRPSLNADGYTALSSGEEPRSAAAPNPTTVAAGVTGSLSLSRPVSRASYQFQLSLTRGQANLGVGFLAIASLVYFLLAWSSAEQIFGKSGAAVSANIYFSLCSSLVNGALFFLIGTEIYEQWPRLTWKGLALRLALIIPSALPSCILFASLRDATSGSSTMAMPYGWSMAFSTITMIIRAILNAQALEGLDLDESKRPGQVVLALQTAYEERGRRGLYLPISLMVSALAYTFFEHSKVSDALTYMFGESYASLPSLVKYMSIELPACIILAPLNIVWTLAVLLGENPLHEKAFRGLKAIGNLVISSGESLVYREKRYIREALEAFSTAPADLIDTAIILVVASAGFSPVALAITGSDPVAGSTVSAFERLAAIQRGIVPATAYLTGTLMNCASSTRARNIVFRLIEKPPEPPQAPVVPVVVVQHEEKPAAIPPGGSFGIRTIAETKPGDQRPASAFALNRAALSPQRAKPGFGPRGGTPGIIQSPTRAALENRLKSPAPETVASR